jgi:hypothetical protein
MKRLVALLLVLIALLPQVALAARLGPRLVVRDGQTLTGRFTQDHAIKGVTIPLHSEGRFLVAPGYGVIWWIEKPMAMTLVLTPNGATQWVGNLPLMKFSAQKNPLLGQAPLYLADALGGRLDHLAPAFQIEEQGSPAAWTLTLTPHMAKKPFERLTVHGGASVHQALALRADGLTDAFSFSDQRVSDGPITLEQARLFDSVPAQP